MKVVIPQFVADYIEKYKEIGFSMVTWFDFENATEECEIKTEQWLYGGSHDERLKREHLLIIAIRFAYEVERV